MVLCLSIVLLFGAGVFVVLLFNCIVSYVLCVCCVTSIVCVHVVRPHQVAHAQHVLEGRGHGVVLHGHEHRVEHDAHGDAQVHEGVHDDEVQPSLQPAPAAAAVPLQTHVSEHVPARGARPLVLLKVWGGGRGGGGERGEGVRGDPYRLT